MPRSGRPALAAALLIALPALAACGDGASPAAVTTTPPATTTVTATKTVTATVTVTPTDARTTASSSGSQDGGDFQLTTGDGQIDISGPATACKNPTESTLAVTFTGDGSTVIVATAAGKGTVRVTGAVEFEGKVTSVEVGDSGNARAAGSGSLSDPGAAVTDFTMTGSCS